MTDRQSELKDRLQKLSREKLELFALTLEQRLHEHRAAAGESIAIVGLACRFPGSAHDPDAFWNLLVSGRDAIEEVPRDRWDNAVYYDPDTSAPGKVASKFGGFIAGVNDFDATLFGISKREATVMDPQQRVLLEVAWEAMERAGYCRETLPRARTGVFVGAFGSDFARRLLGHHRSTIDGYSGTGTALSPLAGRLSYVLGLRGPSMVIDTACSSSLVAVHQACQSLRTRGSDLCFAGGVNLLLSPEWSIAFSKAGMLAPDGRCKSFDASANGYGRAEGCGVLLLKRLSDALADGDLIQAVIRGSAVNQDGDSQGLTAPNGRAQQELLRAALSDAGMQPGDVQYIEAHGTGTSLGDPIEVSALAAVYTDNVARQTPLTLGSVKASIGHAEAAAGMAGLIKAVMAIQHRTIPPQINYRATNPLIDLSRSNLTIPTQPMVWNTERRCAAVSSFGFSGTNAHVIIEAPPVQVLSAGASESPQYLLCLSAQSEPALNALVDRYSRYLDATTNSVADICHSAAAGRSHFRHRATIRANNIETLRNRVTALKTGAPAPGVGRGEVTTARGDVAFLFTGQGSQWVGMGETFYRTEPRFRDAIDRCSEALQSRLGVGLPALLWGDASRRLNETRFTQPAIFALEYALGEWWSTAGITPGAVVGHSIGEYAAAHRAGVFSLEDALTLIEARGRLMSERCKPGGMLAVRCSEADLAPYLRESADVVCVAVTNGPNSIVLAGAADALERVQTRLTSDTIKSTRLSVSHAFHSPQMRLMCDAFRRVSERITYHVPRIRFISTVSGLVEHDAIACADYWVAQIEAPVRFDAAIRTLAGQNIGVGVELGPDATLLGMTREIFPDATCRTASTLRRKQDAWESALDAVAMLYRDGHVIDWNVVSGSFSHRRVPIPTYPFKRECFALGETEVETARETSSSAPMSEHLYRLVWRDQATFSGIGLGGPKMSTAVFTKPAIDALQIMSAEERKIAADGIAAVNRFAIEHIISALAKLGVDARAIANTDTSVLLARFGIVAAHRRLIVRFRELLDQAGLFSRTDMGFTASDSELQTRLEQLCAAHPLLQAELELVAHAGQSLPQVLRGELNALDVLFSDRGGASRVYHESATMRVLNRQIVIALQKILTELPPSQGVRILEIGAGTGATTAEVATRLPSERVEYCFTDLSPAFLVSAREKFSHCRFMQFRELDIEQPPVDQGFAERSFDVVIATNVLHATRDVHETLKNARTLLAPGGLLVLNELTHAQAWLDISFGMTEGWWRFSDSALRKYHPLLSAVQWRSVVEASGCEEFTLLQDEPDPAAAVMVARVPATSVRKEPCTRWLLLSDDAIGVPLASALSAIGRHCTMMRPNASAEHISNALAVLAVDGVDELSVVYVCTGDTDWRSALTLTQTLVNAGVPRLRLWFVTRSAVGVDGLCPEAGLSQATLWGLARVIALEHPELDCRMIDIDATSTPTAIQQLVAELTSSSLENQVVWRGARRRVARLALATSNVQPAAFRDNASYLIAGGLGGLGLLIARWMVERGARELVLCGSSEPTVAQLSEIKRIEALGAHVTAYRADITDGAQVDKMLSKIQCTLPPLRGVINAAGILRDAVLARQDENGFRAVLSPKIDGTWNLHRATLNCPLDFFVLFSSIVALLGNPGQANHAAANAFEDSFAHYRHALGLPALSINWGVWTEVGAAAARGFDSKLEASSTGLKSISPQIGLAAFERVLFSNSVQVVVTTADWSKMAQTYPHMRSFLQDVCSQATAREENKNTARASLRRQWECAPPQERRGLLQQRIRELLATVLGLDSPALIESDQVFANLGFDSLVAIDFRNRLANALGHALPSTTLFDYPTLDKLTGFIVAEVFGLTIDHENRTSSTRTQDKRTMLDVASLSEDQAEAMLLEELKRG